MPLHETLGLIGVAIVLIAYFMLTSRRWKNTDARYLLANIIGTSLILYSLLFDKNYPAILAQIVWIAISVIALAKTRRKTLSS